MTGTLSGKVAIITGASSGMGTAMTRRLAADGASVIVHHVKGRERADALVSQLRQAGGKAEAVGADLTDIQAVPKLLDAAHTAFGGLDILILNAGAPLLAAPLVDMPREIILPRRHQRFVSRSVLMMGANGRCGPAMNDMTAIRKLRCGACSEQVALFPFTMAFQPVIDLETGQIYAHEALVRGTDGSSAKSILDRVTDQNRYAFDQACRVKAIEMAAMLGIDVTLNINFLPNAVYDPRACIRLTLDAAARTGFPTDRITFEIIEAEQIADDNHLRDIIAEYRRHGFRVALDDFGTGYSGLSRLARLKPDILKLDRDLIAGCGQDGVRRQIIVAMSRLCDTIGTQLVAEGIETSDELAVVRDAGVRFAQGYHFARPAFERLVQQNELHTAEYDT